MSNDIKQPFTQQLGAALTAAAKKSRDGWNALVSRRNQDTNQDK